MIQLMKFYFTGHEQSIPLRRNAGIFLQTFILELMHANEQLGQKHCEQLIEHIAKTAGCFFEETYRDNTHNNGPLDIESYTELILGLKNNIGGKFSLVSANRDCVAVTNSCCPFGEQVTDFPELCRMTSSVFGGIAARNFGYAKVEIRQSIARRHGRCEVCVYTRPERCEKGGRQDGTDAAGGLRQGAKVRNQFGGL